VKTRLEMLASQRQHLVERSALCRQRLQRDMLAVRGAASWKRLPEKLATAPAARTMAWSLAMSLLGTGRAARVLVFAGRALLVARLAYAAIGYARARARPA
jgi:DNA-binding transcriptional regulator/RsmH inhibitor MraZ